MTDYTEQWPKLVPEWCRAEIESIDGKLKGSPSAGKKATLEYRKSMLQRIQKDYEDKLG